MFLADFHIHSNFSDGKLSIPEIVDLYGRRGFGAIAITDHVCEESKVLGQFAAYLGKTLTQASFPLYQEILRSEAERAMDQYGMLLIPGVELTKNSLFNHRAAHIVALGVSDWIRSDDDVEALLKNIKRQGAVSIAAHPLGPQIRNEAPYHLWDRRDELASHFDAWEITYGSQLLREVLKTKLPKIASSDLHHPKHMTSWKTVLTCERSLEAVQDAIRKQDLTFHFYKEEVHDVADSGREPLVGHFWPQPLGVVAGA